MMLKRKSESSLDVELPPRKVQMIRISSLPDRLLFLEDTAKASPEEIVVKALNDSNIGVEFPSFSDLNDFFQPPTQEEIDAYDHTVINAIRSEDIPTLKTFHKEGRPLKCSNKFGESLLHMACRKGMLDVTSFLVQEAGVPLTVCDDYGRSPLHDACWSRSTDFKLIDLILDECPDLLYIRDRRGNTPLSYIRREEWSKWQDYLSRKSASSLMPRVLKHQKLMCNSSCRAA